MPLISTSRPCVRLSSPRHVRARGAAQLFRRDDVTRAAPLRRLISNVGRQHACHYPHQAMNSLPIRALMSLAAVLIAGCATPNPTVSADTANRLKTIGVISVAANTFTRQYVGVTVFGNEREQKNLSSWNVNATYEAQLASAIESVFGAKAVQRSYSPAAFAKLHDLNGPWDAPAFSGPNWSAIEGATLSYCATTGVDAVVIAGRVKTGDIFGRTNQAVEGLGIYSRRGTSIMHLLAVVGLLDCRTGKPLAARSFSSQGSPTPMKRLSEELGRMRIAEWTPEVEQELKKMAIELPDEAWADALKRMVPTAR